MPTVKRTNDDWRALLADQRASGQSQEAWCAANGINLYTLRDRSSRLKKMERAPEPQTIQPETVSVGWVDVTPEKLPSEATGISVARGGFTITVKMGFDAELLTEVLRAVSRACC